MEPQERDRFEQALERKQDQAAEREERGKELAGTPTEAGVDPESQNLTGADRQQEDASVRDKNTTHKKVTADKWNQ